MNDILGKVDTIILLMFENRSFDHMLGHLSLENINSQVDGLREPLSQYESLYQGDIFNPFALLSDSPLPFDLPHEYNDIAVQLSRSPVTQRFTMSGFVEAYAKSTGVTPNPQSQPMGFFTSGQVPISSFLASNFCTCDRWFAPLPTSTQPNRTVAFTGDSRIYNTVTRLIPTRDSIYDWMTRQGIRWRVYHDGLSFFILYPRLWHYVLGNHFRDYEYLYRDLVHEPADTAPQVIIVEPSYQDSPHIGSDRPNDNHAPLAIGWGEEFLRRTYQAVTANPQRWASTVMIVYYDEHGGFYDHVPPPHVPFKTSGDAPMQFGSLGPRIPGMIVSPFVKPGSVSHSLFDHTSVLQLLAEKFTPGKPYSGIVDQRSKQSPAIESISAALTNPVPGTPPQAPTRPITVTTALGKSIETAPAEGMASSFELAAQALISDNPGNVAEKYPELLQWQDAVARERRSLKPPRP